MSGSVPRGFTPEELASRSEEYLSLPELRRALVGATVMAITGDSSRSDNVLTLTIERGGVQSSVVLIFNELGLWLESVHGREGRL